MRQTLTQLGWFVGLWSTGVIVCGTVAFCIRLWLRS
jgi:hypothetical protein